MDVARWLRGLGLQRYEQAFRQNDVDAQILPELTGEDLVGLGVNSVGHRRKLLAAHRGTAGRGIANSRLGSALGTSPDVVLHLGIRRCRASTAHRHVQRLVGSTALSSSLDSEDLRDVIGAYHKCVTAVVARFDGFVARYMGDGILAYFGYPSA